MHVDLNSREIPERIHTEICLIGAGAAGITLARRLLHLGHEVTLLESGGLDYETDTADLNAGENVGEQYYDLEDARLRFFGGTTAIWGGRVAELDPIDLQPRPWVPHSGWPIEWSDLAEYYPQARKVFDLPASTATAEDFGRGGVRIPEFDPARLEVGVWDFDRRFNRFQFAACRDLPAHPRCRVVTHATATELHLHPAGHHVESVSVRTLGGRSLKVFARVVIVAAGGLENPRLLLASRAMSSTGIGNEHDQVGRYFMEHPHARGGRIMAANAWPLLQAFGRPHGIGGREVAALIKPSEQLQRQQGILNTSLTIKARPPADGAMAWGMRAYMRIKHSIAPTRGGRALWMTTKKAATWVKSHIDPVPPWLLYKTGQRELALLVRAEQAPNPRSRVVLTDRLDALGTPRLALDWHMSALDVDSVRGVVEALRDELSRLNMGRVEAAEWLRGEQWRTDALISAHPLGGYHHMGTTRMSRDPRKGVTDATGRVHGVENLYIAGSSLFPTSGWANPTLTVLALALRTGDRISSRLASAAAA